MADAAGHRAARQQKGKRSPRGLFDTETGPDTFGTLLLDSVELGEIGDLCCIDVAEGAEAGCVEFGNNSGSDILCTEFAEGVV